MTADASFEASLATLAAERPELGIVAPASPGLETLSEVVSGNRLDTWLAETASIAEGVDPRTAAAYLISIFVWRFDEILAGLYLGGAPMPRMDASHVRLHMVVAGGPGQREIRFRFAFDHAGDGRAFDLAAFRAVIEAVHAPMVDALHQRTGLSRNALWRLVGDGVTGGLLAFGKHGGSVHEAMAVAREVARHPPLGNRQWDFVEIAASDAEPQWFRLRGGCCRLYRTVGGSLCTTCVLRSRASQLDQLRAFVGASPSPAA